MEANPQSFICLVLSFQELVHLEHLLLQSQQDLARLSSPAVAEHQRQVIVIVSEPLIAIRYQLANGQVGQAQQDALRTNRSRSGEYR